MKLIAITPELDVQNEQHYVSLLIAEGFIVHCRKPSKKSVDMAAYLRNFAPEFRNSLVIHDHHEIAIDMGIKRLHFPEMKRKETDFTSDKYAGLLISTSVHEKETLASENLNLFNYIFCGPVFSSISKPDYHGREYWQSVFEEPTAYAKIALGGMTPEKMIKIMKWGYDGAAFSGYLWDKPEEMDKRINRIKDVWLKDLTY